MNATHATVAVGGTSAMAALTTLLTGWHDLDADHAAALAWLICNAAAAIYGGVQWFVSWRWPSASRSSTDAPGSAA